MRANNSMQRIFSALAVTLLIVPAAKAATEVGQVVATRGTVEVRRASAGNWKPASLGAPLYASDEIRSDKKGSAKLLFGDDAVVDLGRSSEMSIKRFQVAGNDNVLGVSSGRIRVFLSDTLAASGRSFEVETPTAVVRAQGTIFVVDYDSSEQLTRVFGVEGIVDVQGSIGLIGPTLKVGPGQQTRVQEGKFPEPAQVSDTTKLAELSADVEVVGTGRQDGIAASHPALVGTLTRSDEKPSAISAVASAPSTTGDSDSAQGRAVSYLDPRVPGDTLLHRLSPAARANTQPLLEYEPSRAPGAPGGFPPDQVPPPLRR